MTDVPSALGHTGMDEVLEQFPAFIAVYEGPHLHCVFANAAARAIVGGRDFVGLPLREALPEFADQGITALVERVLQDGRPGSAHEWRVQLAGTASDDPLEVYVNFEAVPWCGADGRQRGVITTGTLVTEMVQARLAAREQTRDAEQRYARARADVETLQRAFLPVELPVLPGTEIAAHYVVAASEQAAGGDWFDAVVLDDANIALVVGDVVGHGIDASAAMGQLRAVVLELLESGTDLADVLERADAFARRHAASAGATLCVAVLDQVDGALRWVAAGHPSPLVVGPDGTTRRLVGTSSRPLATSGPLGTPNEDRLERGEVVVLYTDGLVERPNRSLEQGIAELERVVAAAAANRLLPEGAPRSQAERVCELAVELLTRTGWTDDVTVIAAHRRAADVAPLHIEIDDISQLSAARAQVGAWMTELGIDGADVDAVRLAVSETVTNSLEHGYQGRSGTVHLRVALTLDGRLEGEVADSGQWRQPVPGDELRGRGLALVRQLVDDVQLAAGAEGTTVCFATSVHRRAVLDSPRSDDGEVIAAAHAGHVSGAEAQFALDVDSPDPGVDAPVVVSVHGPLDVTTAEQFTATLTTATRGLTLPAIVDLTASSHLASAGVRELHRHRRSADGGPPLRLRAPVGTAARQVIELVGLADLLED